MNSQVGSTSAEKIHSVSLENHCLMIVWEDGQQQKIEPAVLRHSPGFPGGQRPAGPAGRFPKAANGFAPRQATVTTKGDLQLIWQPGNVTSTHQLNWLRNCMTDRTGHNDTRLQNVVLWDANRIKELPVLEFDVLVGSDQERLNLFDQVLDWGVAKIRNVPATMDTVQVIADWFGQIPPNPYADNPDNPAISSIRVDPKTPVATHMCHFLGPHTDTCWRQTLIGLLLMHCLKAHPQGGRSLLVDGYTVASRLRETAAEAFRLLSSVPLNFGAKVEDLDDWRVLGRVISLAADGVIEGVRYNGNSIGQLELPAELIAPMYAALESFEAVLYDQSLWWQPLLQPGDALVIDNHRVLHGRHAFDPDLGDRHLQTCNVDRDDFHNRYRRFAKRMGSSRWNQRFTAGVI